MNETPTPFDSFERIACSKEPCPYQDRCIDSEMALRHYTYDIPLPPMTPEQREWCLDEIGHVEGYDRLEWFGCTDAQLAKGVLQAWADYCRDKGLL